MSKVSRSRSARKSTGLARNWWAIGLRGTAGILFAIAVLWLPASTIASLVLMFAAYVAADGAFAVLAGMRAAGRGDRWRMLILEGAINLAAAAGVLVWQAVAIVPLVHILSAWAVVTGALLLAAAHRLSGRDGRWVLRLGGKRVGRLGCIGSGNRRRRHADDWMVVNRLRASIW